jgi:hypothetical protein
VRELLRSGATAECRRRGDGREMDRRQLSTMQMGGGVVVDSMTVDDAR